MQPKGQKTQFCCQLGQKTLPFELLHLPEQMKHAVFLGIHLIAWDTLHHLFNAARLCIFLALCCISVILKTPYVAWELASGQAGHTHSSPDEEHYTGRESSIPEVRLCSWSVCSSGPSCLSWAAPLPSLKALGPEQNPLWPANLVQQGLREQRPGAPALTITTRLHVVSATD